MVTHGDEQHVVKWLNEPEVEDGNPIGWQHQNPIMLDMHEYIVEPSDRTTAEYAAMLLLRICTHNVILKDRNIYCYEKKLWITERMWQHTYVRSRLDAKHVVVKKTRQKTTKGWQLLVSWKDGTTDWLPLKELKVSNPIELQNYKCSSK